MLRRVMMGANAAGGGAVTWNSADKSADITLSGSDLIATRSSASDGSWRAARANTSKSSGKKYFEIVNVANGSVNGAMIGGLSNASQGLTSYMGSSSNSFGWQANNTGGARPYYNAVAGSFFGSYAAAGQRAMFAVDFDAGKIWFGINGTWSGDPAAGTGAVYTFTPNASLFPAISESHASQQCTGCFKIADFGHSVPSGFSAWE